MMHETHWCMLQTSTNRRELKWRIGCDAKPVRTLSHHVQALDRMSSTTRTFISFQDINNRTRHVRGCWHVREEDFYLCGRSLGEVGTAPFAHLHLLEHSQASRCSDCATAQTAHCSCSNMAAST